MPNESSDPRMVSPEGRQRIREAIGLPRDDRCENEKYQEAKAIDLEEYRDHLQLFNQEELRRIAWEALLISDGPESTDVEEDHNAARFYVNYADGWLGPTFSITDKKEDST